MITDITLTNFKGFRHLEIQPKRITAFVGPNGTGKSSVLQAFGLVKQKVEFPHRSFGLVLNGPLMNLPGSDAIIANCGRGNTVIQFCGYGSGPASGFECRVEFSVENMPDPTTFNVSDAEPALKALKMVPALRGFTHPVYKLGDAPVKDVSLQPGIEHREAQTATNLGYAPAQLEQVSRMLKKVTGVALKAITVPPQSVELMAASPTGPINIIAEGFGTNSLIMLLLQLVSAERGATVMIEEPEIHLHPKAQADLAEVLAKEALAGDKQVIMTTHSEHITGRLLTLVAERTLTPEDLAIYAFAKDAETGACSANPLKINDDGGVEGGVKDFFDTNLAEMNRFVEAQFAQDKEKLS